MADTTDSHGQRPCKPPHLQLHFLASFSRRRRSAPPPGRPDAGPLAQAAARRCPATIRLTGGASRQRVGWCSDPQLCDHEFLGVLFSLLARLSTVAVFRAGGSLRIHARTRVPEATCPAFGALSRRVHLRSGWARWGCCWPTGQMDSRGQLATLGA